MKLLLAFLLLFFTLDGVGQITFNKRISFSHGAILSDIKQTNDDGFAIVGNKYSQTSSGIILIKTDEIGDTSWIQNYFIPGFYSTASDFEVLEDGYLIAGTRRTTINNYNSYDCFLIRTDTLGQVIWSKIYTNASLSQDEVSLIKTNDNGFIIKGSVLNLTNNSKNIKIIKTDSLGNLEWDKTYEALENGGNNSKVIQIDSNYFICTHKSLIKTNAAGEIEWIKDYDLPYGCATCNWINKFYFSSISKVDDGLLIGGGYYVDDENRNSLVLKTDFEGNIVWEKSYNMNANDGVIFINPANDGFVLGLYNNAGSNWSSRSFIKIDFNGECQFSGGIVTSHDSENCEMIQTSDNGYAYVNLETDFDIDPSYICNFWKINSNGRSNCKSTFNLNSDTITVIGFVGGQFDVIPNTFSQSAINVEMFREGGIVETFCLNDTNSNHSSVLNETVCDSSYTLNGQVYNQSGTYNQVIQNYFGYDSTITLNLTINNPTTSALNETACESFSLNNQTYTQSGTYIQNLQNNGGCDSTITLNLTIININPAITNNSNILTAQQAGASYQWIDCDLDAIIPGATNQTFTPTHVGEYAVQIMIGNCTETSNCVVVNNVTLEENQLENGFDIFPNPFTREAKIVFNMPQTNTTIRLLDILCKELQSVSFSGTEYTLYRESLSASMYFVQITDASGKVATRKIVLE